MVNRMSRLLTNDNLKKTKQWKEKNEIKFQDTTCVSCDKDILENTEHIFECESKKEHWKQAGEKMLKIFNKKTNKTYQTLPFWFSVDLPACTLDGVAAKSLMGFNKS